MALDFVGIDFETANFSRASACSVGVVRVEGGKLRDSTEWFIDPPGGAYFTNTFIHGVVEADVFGAPSWDDTLDPLSPAQLLRDRGLEAGDEVAGAAWQFMAESGGFGSGAAG